MFAGLPGIGVGTLFYVLTALLMPVLEIARVAQGTSSLARWRRIGLQLFFALSIVLSVMFAERVLLFILGEAGPGSLNPARLLNHELASRAPRSILAAPVTASLLLLGAVLLIVEVLRIVIAVRRARQVAHDTNDTDDDFVNEALNSTSR